MQARGEAAPAGLWADVDGDGDGVDGGFGLAVAKRGVEGGHLHEEFLAFVFQVPYLFVGLGDVDALDATFFVDGQLEEHIIMAGGGSGGDVEFVLQEIPHGVDPSDIGGWRVVFLDDDYR